ncbi:hypothetical protein TspCOW1_23070 [Thiohalobacter sp. COW1]|uniref:disulfide bond formation protein B n=1 Tax=Thiohalobacter sp. COW1 TaxID=2795687 RepID=UPI0019158664|nr:disulfide bond formation protein B [Thiohalobacter sp. COW1]BCO32204.1 hypothetical protein TspCOW1_23070 [Thiohalobacter sp. COW1]
MLERLNRIGTSAFYWLALLVLVLLLEGVALFYQYRLDYWPCVLCIHVRIWLAALGLLALLMLALRRLRGGALLGHLTTAGIGLGLLERAWLLLGTERGFIEDAGCGMDLGLPAWLALDDWLPWLFEVQTSCGYTPELPLGITMAEALLAFSAALTLLGLGLALATLAAGRR